MLTEDVVSAGSLNTFKAKLDHHLRIVRGTENSWWGGWMQTAKEKSMSMLNVVKHDLTEFTSVMHEDSTKVASAVKEKFTHENASAASEKVKYGMSTLLGGLSKVLVVKPDDDYQPVRIVDGEAVVFDRAKARLHAIQIDPSTYTTEPVADGKYEEWQASQFNMEEMKGDISDLLVSNVEVRALYTQLVPFTVTNVDFWRRYFFRKHLLEEEEARRLELMKRADDVSNEETELGWDEDDDVATDTKNTAPTSSARKTTSDPKPSIPADLADDSLTTEKTTDSENPTGANLIDTKPDLAADHEPVESSSTSEPVVKQESEELTPTAESYQLLPERTHSDEPLDTLDDVVPEKAAGQKVKASESSQSFDPSLGSWSTLSDSRAVEEDLLRVDVCQVASDQGPRTPSSDENKSSTDDWEKDFDVEVTEEDIQTAREAAKKIVTDVVKDGVSSKDEDWEEW